MSAQWLIKGWARMVFFKLCYRHLVQKSNWGPWGWAGRTVGSCTPSSGTTATPFYFTLNFNILLLNSPKNFKGLSWYFMIVWLNIFMFMSNIFICRLSFIFLSPAVKIHWIHRSFSVSIAIIIYSVVASFPPGEPADLLHLWYKMTCSTEVFTEEHLC